MNPRIPHHKVVMVLHPLYVPQLYLSEVSITVLYLLRSPHYKAVQIKKCSKVCL